MDSNKQLLTILLLFDYSKALDTIAPSRLLRKLSAKGFSRRVILWIKFYITGRDWRVITKMNGLSDWLTNNLGVHRVRSWSPSYSAYISMIWRMYFGTSNENGVSGLLQAVYFIISYQKMILRVPVELHSSRLGIRFPKPNFSLITRHFAIPALKLK